MSAPSFEAVVEQIVARDPRYRSHAYSFVKNALTFTQKQTGSSEKSMSHHVSGKQLLEGIRVYAVNTFGSQTQAILNGWGICSCEDFGEIVFNLVDSGQIKANENDSRADFRDGYDFAKVFPSAFYHSPMFIALACVFVVVFAVEIVLSILNSQ